MRPSSELWNLRVVWESPEFGFGVRSEGYIGWDLQFGCFHVGSILIYLHFQGRGYRFLLQFSVEVSGPILGKVVKERMLTPPVSM